MGKFVDIPVAEWIIFVKDLPISNSFIVLDQVSGGYPTFTEYWKAKRFQTKQKAIEYATGMSGYIKDDWEVWCVDSIRVNFTEVATKYDETEYQKELEALNKKYGRN